MTSLIERFQKAAADSKGLPSRPDDMTMMKMYALFKQGSNGDAGGNAPSDMVGMFKHNAWAELKGMPKDDAMQRYIDLVDSLR